jgi:hypothetical protein
MSYLRSNKEIIYDFKELSTINNLYSKYGAGGMPQ